jgi:hypothetical protein
MELLFERQQSDQQLALRHIPDHGSVLATLQHGMNPIGRENRTRLGATRRSLHLTIGIDHAHPGDFIASVVNDPS